MNTKYFYTQLKRIFYLKNAMVFNLILSLAAIAFILVYTNHMEPDSLKLKLGIVSDDESSYLGMGVDIINTVDAAASRISFLSMTRDDANKALKSGKIIGYLYVPSGFVEGLKVGENKEISYVTSRLGSDIINDIMCEISDIVSVLIVNSERSIYAMQSYMDDRYIDNNSYNRALDDMNIMLMKKVFGRDLSFDIRVLDLSSTLSYEKYYLISFFIVYSFLMGMAASVFVNKNNLQLQKILSSKGVSIPSQVFIEYFAYNIFLIVSILLLIIGAFIILFFFGNNFQVFSVRTLIQMILPISLLLSSMTLFVFEISSDRTGGIIILSLVCSILSILGGCFYPIRTFPDNMQAFCRLTPLHFLVKYAHKVILGENGGYYLGFIFIYTIFFILLTIFIRRVRINYG